MKNDLESVGNYFKLHPFKKYQKYETFFRAEDKPQHLFYLESGYVRQYYLTANGDELTINIFKPRSFFLVTWLYGQTDTNYYFETLNKSRIYQAPLTATKLYFEENPKLLLDLTQRLARGLIAQSERLHYLVYGSAQQKVAATILNLAKRFGRAQGKTILIDLPLTHRLIASMAALARETCSLEIEDLRKNGIIRSRQQAMAVLDMKRLSEAAQAE